MPRKKNEVDMDGPGPVDRQENLPVVAPVPEPPCQISSRSEPFFSQPSATTEVVDCNDCVIEWP
jgi:hypothetical protein